MGTVGLAALSASLRPGEDSRAGASGGWGEEEIEGHGVTDCSRTRE